MNPLRNALLWSSTNPTLSERLPKMGFVKRAARRFMPGEEISDALGEAKKLASEGFPTTITQLGENVDDPESARRTTDHYLEVLDTLEGMGIDLELSVKPTQLGLDLGASVAKDHLVEIVEAAGRLGRGTVWIDMESSPYVDATLDLFRVTRERADNVGICLQSYLYRTREDLENLMPLQPAVRFVKGAYREPVSVAFPEKKDVDRAFVELCTTLMRARAEGSGGRPVAGTHDAVIHQQLAAVADDLELQHGDWEFAMLYGIGVGDQRRMVQAGHQVRVLISYGSHWFPWYMRRLAERPANIGFVLRKMVGL